MKTKSVNPLLSIVFILDYASPGFALIDRLPAYLPRLQWDLLLLLCERAPKVVSKKAILDSLWENVIVEAAQVDVQLAGLKKTLAIVSPGREGLIASVPRRGVFVNLSPGQIVILPLGGVSAAD